jgi:hypothetical protein
MAPHRTLAMTAMAVAAVAFAVVVTLVLRFRAELADATPSSTLTAVEAAASPAAGDPSALPAAAEGPPPAASCVSSELATRATQPRAFGIGRSPSRERLLVSRDAEHLAAAAMMTRNVRERVADITKAMAIGSQNATIVWLAVQICGAASGRVPCPEQEWEEQLLKLDGENSEAWIQVAARRLERGDGGAAFDAMQRAASAAETNVYWPETVELAERGLAAAGGHSFADRAALAFGVAAANQPDYKSYVDMCKARSDVDRAWADACLHYGAAAEQRRKTVLGETSARTLQIAVLEAIGDDFGVAEVRARVPPGIGTVDRRRADAMITSGPRPFALYLAKLRESGESAAVAYMLDEGASPTPLATAECPPRRPSE